MNTSARKITIAGYDGSAPAEAALMCAARRAVSGTRLVVAHVAAVPIDFLESAYYDDVVERLREQGAEMLEDVAARVPAGVSFETTVLSGSAAHALVKCAHELGATEIAIGSRGFGLYRAAALGSTSHALLHESDRPVLVVPRRALEREQRRPVDAEKAAPTVVTGYDGSVNARAALGYAAQRVAEAGRVVATYVYQAPADWIGAPYYQRALDEHQERGRGLLSELESQGIASGELETELIEGSPAEGLVRVAHAHNADEIVVGSRGLGRFRAALGSVSHELLHEADLPLVVVPGT